MNFESLETAVTNKLQYLESNIKFIDSCVGSRDTLNILIQEENDKLAKLQESVTLYDKCSQFLQGMHEMVQKQLDKIELICTQSIQSILDSPEIVFKIVLEKKRNNIDTSFIVVDKVLGNIDLTHGEAGGTKNVVSVCLRLIFAELCSPRVDGPIVLDEAGGNISEDFQQGFGKFLRTFSELTNRQIILVSHFKPVISEAKSVITLVRPGDPKGQEVLNASV